MRVTFLWSLPLAASLAACQAPPAALPALPLAPNRAVFQAGSTPSELEPAFEGAQILTPIGTTASSSLNCLVPERAIDGDLATNWANAPYMEPEAWVTLAFSDAHVFNGVRIKTGALPPGLTFKFATSDNGEVWTPSSGRLVNTTWGMEFQDVIGDGKYLRLRLFNHMTAPVPHFSVYEIQVFGRKL